MLKYIRIVIILILGGLLVSCGSSRKSTKKGPSSKKNIPISSLSTQVKPNNTTSGVNLSPKGNMAELPGASSNTTVGGKNSVDCSLPPASALYPDNTWNTEHVRYKKTQIPAGSHQLLLIDNLQVGFVMPVKGKVISEFGIRSGRAHTGIDIKLKSGDPVHCAFAGVVRMAKLYSSYGNVVVVRHYNGLETVYSHLSSISVKVNQLVEAGDLLGKGGRTGRATTDHLHFEVRFLSEPFNPREIIDFDNFELINNYYTLSPAVFTDPFNKGILSKTTIASAMDSAENNGYIIHKVEKGNTLYNLSRLYKTTVKEICRLNGINESTTLSIGQKLKVPVAH